MGYLWVQVVVVYSSDDTNNYNVGLSQSNATPGGFTAAPAGAQINYPKPWRMRHIYGVNGLPPDQDTHKLPCQNSDLALWKTGTNFIVAYLQGSTSFIVQGRKGEQRRAKI